MSVTIKLRFSPTHLDFNPQKITKKIKFADLKTKIRSKSIYHFNPLIAFLHKPRMQAHQLVQCSLIEPDGGSLVDLVVPESERAAKILEAKALPKVKLTHIDFEWVHVISERWATPLSGFMREDEYLKKALEWFERFSDHRRWRWRLENYGSPIKKIRDFTYINLRKCEIR